MGTMLNVIELIVLSAVPSSQVSLFSCKEHCEQHLSSPKGTSQKSFLMKNKDMAMEGPLS